MYSVHPVYFSDHCLVVATFGSLQSARTPRSWKLWKMNSRILDDSEFDNFVRLRIARLYDDLRPWALRWEAFKQDVRAHAIERSNILAYHAMHEENRLHEAHRALLELEGERPGAFYAEIKEVQLRLDLFNQSRFEGAKIRSRIQRYLPDEAPNKSSVSGERKQARCRLLRAIDHQGRQVTDLAEIMDIFVEYYRNLFGKAPGPVHADLIGKLTSTMPRLTADDASFLAADITDEEIHLAIGALSLNRSPGPDGLGAEFYKKFSNLLAPVLRRVYVEAETAGMFSPSFRRSHTVLIPKKVAEGSTRKVTDYRPITLCNADYKIYAKVLAARTQLVIHKLVGEHQTCGIKHRAIQTNIHLVRTILEWCTSEADCVAMVQLDLSKAFDRVSHPYLFALLQYMNMGETFVNRIKLCYKDVATCLVINNTLTAPITLMSSVRQGCPLSPLLFDLYLEPLCRLVISRHDIVGFHIQNTVVKVVAYADDIAFFVRDKRSVENVFQQVALFCEASGADVNQEKSLGVWYGQWGTTPDSFCGIHWQTEKPHYLGVPLKDAGNTNSMWRRRLENMKKHALTWKQRDLSIFQRASLCNIFLAAKLLYLLQVLPCSRRIIHACHRVFATTIWCSTFERMRRENLFKAVKGGGLGLHHIFVQQLTMRLWFYRKCQHPLLESIKRAVAFNYLPQLYAGFRERSLQLTGFYKEVVDSIKFLMVRFSPEYLFSVSRRTLNADLVDTLFPVPIYRQVALPCPGLDVLCRVKKMSIKPNLKSFFFKVHTSTLPVKAWLQQKGFFVPWSTNCRFCRVPETINHIFLDCTEAQFFWDDIQMQVLQRRLHLNPHTIRFLPLRPEEDTPYDVIILIGMFCLWKLRMADRNEEPLTPPLEYFKIEIHQLKLACMQRLQVPRWLDDVWEQLSSL